MAKFSKGEIAIDNALFIRNAVLNTRQMNPLYREDCEILEESHFESFCNKGNVCLVSYQNGEEAYILESSLKKKDWPFLKELLFNKEKENEKV